MPSASDRRRAAAPTAPAVAADPRSPLARVGRPVALLAGVALVLAFPFMAPNAYILSASVVILSYAVLATSWNVVGGFTGYISLGHAAWWGLGAYGTGLLITKASLPSFVALVLAGVIVAVVAIPVGVAALRVRGASFVIVSIALVLVLLLVFQSWGAFTGGSNGLVVPRPFPDLRRPEHHLVFFYLFAALLAVALVVWWVIDRSRFGLGLKAVREDEDKAQALGVPTFLYKLVAYVVSATLTGLGGGLYALWFGDLDPIFQFSILVGSYMVLMALLGGVRHLFGPLLGAVVVGVAIEYFKLEYGDTQFHLVATGLLLAVVVLFMPDGVIPAVASLLARFRPQQASIREVTAAELLERDRAATAAPSGTPAGPATTTTPAAATGEPPAVESVRPTEVRR